MSLRLLVALKLSLRENERVKPFNFPNGANSRRARPQKSIGYPVGVTSDQVKTDLLKGNTLNMTAHIKSG